MDVVNLIAKAKARKVCNLSTTKGMSGSLLKSHHVEDHHLRVGLID